MKHLNKKLFFKNYHPVFILQQDIRHFQHVTSLLHLTIETTQPWPTGFYAFEFIHLNDHTLFMN